MIRHDENGLTYYRFENLAAYPRLAHGVFTRHGGVSPPPCRGLNLAFSRHDDQENVLANRRLAAQTLGIDSMVYAGQVHGDQALLVRADDGYRPAGPDEALTGYDALITPDPGVGLLMKLADCQGVLLFDPRTNVLATIHSGWRGSVSNILGKTTTRLKADFGVDPADLLAGVSPSLGPCCAEFVNYRQELPASFHDYRRGNLFDFWAISRDQLIEAGLARENIEIAGMCTKCGTEGFFSYRREKITGRFGLIAAIYEEE